MKIKITKSGFEKTHEQGYEETIIEIEDVDELLVDFEKLHNSLSWKQRYGILKEIRRMIEEGEL